MNFKKLISSVLALASLMLVGSTVSASAANLNNPQTNYTFQTSLSTPVTTPVVVAVSSTSSFFNMGPFKLSPYVTQVPANFVIPKIAFTPIAVTVTVPRG